MRKTSFTLAASIVLTVLCQRASCETKSWTSPQDGNWNEADKWTPPGVPGAGDSVFITNAGSYTIVMDASIALNALQLGGGSGTQCLAFNSGALSAVTGTVLAGGQLIHRAGYVEGNWTVAEGGKLQFTGTAYKQLQRLHLVNFGTVSWLEGTLNGGGNPLSSITNRGDWVISCDGVFYGSSGLFINEGHVRKTAGAGTARFYDHAFHNFGEIAADQGTLSLEFGRGTQLGGIFQAAQSAAISVAGDLYEAGGQFVGPGACFFHDPYGGSKLTLRTNPVPGLAMVGGVVLLGPQFQDAGAITNLLLEGSTLTGNNRIGAGLLRMTAGAIEGQLEVSSAGKLRMEGSAYKNIYRLRLVNDGQVSWLGGTLQGGGDPPTLITNRGSWVIGCDAIHYGGGKTTFVNENVMVKDSAAGKSTFHDLSLINTGSLAISQGTCEFSFSQTFGTGTFALQGGRFNGLRLAGGTLTGSGEMGPFTADSGTIRPGLNSQAGIIRFTEGLALTKDVSLIIGAEKVGSEIGMDRLVVSGSVSLAGSRVQFEPLPSVPVGQEYVFIENDGADPIQGQFANTADGSLFAVSGQLLRIFYARQSGNDVVFVHDDGNVRLYAQRKTNGFVTVTGRGTNYATYTILSTTDPIAPAWKELLSVPADGGGLFSFVYSTVTNEPACFFRSLGP